MPVERRGATMGTTSIVIALAIGATLLRVPFTVAAIVSLAVVGGSLLVARTPAAVVSP